MRALYNLVVILSIISVVGSFCLVLYRFSQYIQGLSPQRRVVVRAPQQFVTESGIPTALPQRKCNNCEATFTGNMCPECGAVPAPEQGTRRFRGFGSIKKKIEEAG